MSASSTPRAVPHEFLLTAVCSAIWHHLCHVPHVARLAVTQHIRHRSANVHGNEQVDHIGTAGPHRATAHKPHGHAGDAHGHADGRQDDSDKAHSKIHDHGTQHGAHVPRHT